MTQTPKPGGDDATGSTSERQFETVELPKTVPIVPSGTAPDQVLSHAGPAGSSSSSPAVGAITPSGGAGQAQDKAAQVVDQVQEKAGQAADQVQEKAGQVVDQAKQTVTSQVATRKDTAAQTLMTVANAIRQTGQNLRGHEENAVAGYADTAAERVENLSHYLQNRDVNQLVGEVERYARRNPALFLGGAFALGLLGARFLKSSSQPDYDETERDYGRYRMSGSRVPNRYQPTPSRASFQSSAGSQGRYGSTGGYLADDRRGYGTSTSTDYSATRERGVSDTTAGSGATWREQAGSSSSTSGEQFSARTEER